MASILCMIMSSRICAYTYGFCPQTNYFILLPFCLTGTVGNCLFVLLHDVILLFFYLLSLVFHYLPHLETFFHAHIYVDYVGVIDFIKVLSSHTPWVYPNIKGFIPSSYSNIDYMPPRTYHYGIVYVHMDIVCEKGCLKEIPC